MTSPSTRLEQRLSPSDEELFVALGNKASPHFEAAWQRFAETILPNMHRMLRARFLKDRDEHDDWVQNVMLKLMARNPSAVQGEWQGLQAYAVKAVVNYGTDRKRAQKRLQPDVDAYARSFGRMSTPPIDDDSFPDDEMPDITARRRAHLEQVLLPHLKSIQKVVLLALLARDANESISASLNLTPRQLSKHRENALKRLQTLKLKFPLPE